MSITDSPRASCASKTPVFSPVSLKTYVDAPLQPEVAAVHIAASESVSERTPLSPNPTIPKVALISVVAPVVLATVVVPVTVPKVHVSAVVGSTFNGYQRLLLLCFDLVLRMVLRC